MLNGIDTDFDISFSLMNAGGRFNVSPGSQADLSKVVAHYEQRNKDIDASRIARMQGREISIHEEAI